MSDYCLYPSQCGIGMDCSPCYQKRIAELESKLAAAEADAHECGSELRELSKLLPGVKYMDPPDGGNVTIAEQFRRMAEDAKRYLWLRERASSSWAYDYELGVTWGIFSFHSDNAELSFDAAIDAARSAK